MPTIHINPWAMLIAVVANFVLGFLWYTPLFGKMWAREHKFDMTQKPPASAFIKGLTFMIVGSILMAFVFSHNIAAWDPASWGRSDSFMSPAGAAFSAGIFTWLGFIIPSQLSGVAWEGRSWTLFMIDSGYHLCSLLLMALIFIYMK